MVNKTFFLTNTNFSEYFHTQGNFMYWNGDNAFDISNCGVFSFKENKSLKLKEKRILILEDEFAVLSKITRLADKLGWAYDIITSQSKDYLFSFNINNYHYIFADRDNELGFKSNNFHDFILTENLDIDFYKKIIPISWSKVNNEYLRNQVVKKILASEELDSIPAEELLKLQKEMEKVIDKNTFTKSFPDFEEKVSLLLLKKV